MPHLIYELLRIAYLVALIAACGYAFAFGNQALRYAAAIHVVASFASLPAVWLAGEAGWSAGQYPLVFVDFLALGGFVWVAAVSPRFWPLWVAGFHLDAVLTHVAKLLAPGSLPQGYALLQGFWAYPLMIALALGTLAHRRRRHDAQSGNDRLYGNGSS